jgi:hypothetical protein
MKNHTNKNETIASMKGRFFIEFVCYIQKKRMELCKLFTSLVQKKKHPKTGESLIFILLPKGKPYKQRLEEMECIKDSIKAVCSRFTRVCCRFENTV